MKEIKPWDIYKNIKTGIEYTVMDLVINATNAQDGQQMVVYSCEIGKDDPKVFVREINEFRDKFVFVRSEEVNEVN